MSAVLAAGTPVQHGTLWQRSSHDALFSVRSRRVAPPRSGQIDAIVVPASRGAEHLAHVVRLAARVGATLVVLCSQKTCASEVAAYAEREPCLNALIVDVPAEYCHDLLPTSTSAPEFRAASGDRTSDLGLKRNLGLLLARLNGWRKVLFLDDDIGATGRGMQKLSSLLVRRIAGHLERHQIAGMSCRDFPDNSVVCHARKLAGLPQGNFVSGAALGVNCADQPLPFFPDIYNEDWFFFSRRAAAREIGYVGEVSQEPYNPYETADRARHEEFGDLLAEGLYALFEQQPVEMNYGARVEAADAEYWAEFILARERSLHVTQLRLHRALERDTARREREIVPALRSLTAAEGQLGRLRPDLCVTFMEAWTKDLAGWEQATQRLKPLKSVHEACEALSLAPIIVRALPEQRTNHIKDLFIRSSKRPGSLLKGCRSVASIPNSNPSLR